MVFPKPVLVITKNVEINSTTMTSFEQVPSKVCTLVQTLSGVWKSIHIVQTDNSVTSGTNKRGVHVVLPHPSSKLNAAVDHSSQLRQERRYQQNVSGGAGLAQWLSTRLPPMWPGFDSRTRRHKWAEFVGSLFCSERFFSGYSGFPLSSKTNI